MKNFSNIDEEILGNIFQMMIDEDGGVIVSTGELPIEEIEEAREEGRMSVNEDGFGFVYLPPSKLT